MSGDPNLPAPPPDPAPTPSPPPRPSRLTCENCQCQLTPNGDVFRMSDQARAWLRVDEERDRLRAELDEERQAHDTTRGELASARAELQKLQTPEKRKGFFSRE